MAHGPGERSSGRGEHGGPAAEPLRALRQLAGHEGPGARQEDLDAEPRSGVQPEGVENGRGCHVKRELSCMAIRIWA